MASDYHGPATFTVEHDEFRIIVTVTGDQGDTSLQPDSTGGLARKAFRFGLIRVAGEQSVPDTALDKTGELRCDDGQTFVGEFNADGGFRFIETV
jgi:hypothetical protein